MNVVGLEEMLDIAESLGQLERPVALPRSLARRSRASIVLRPWTVSVLAIGIAASCGFAHYVHGPPPAIAHQALHDDLTEASLETAWQSATKRLHDGGHDVGSLLKKATLRIDSWRAAPAVDDDDFDEADEA